MNFRVRSFIYFIFNDEWYTVIGVKEVREGELYHSYEGTAVFINRRRHRVAVLATAMNRTRLALLNDLYW